MEIIQPTQTVVKRLKRAFFPARIPGYRFYTKHLKGKAGLEVGGPTKLFGKRGLIPVYPVLKSLDGCNFCAQTVWEGRIAEGPGRYHYAKSRTAGRQYVSEAVDLRGIDASTYDVVLSSHCLEHVANPLRALIEWVRVLKEDGLLLLVVPHKDGTFDHRRPVTTLAHLVEDFERPMGEDDLSHMTEILELHDLSMDPPAGDRESFQRRSFKNFENRCLHHHVFDTDLVVRLLDHVGLSIVDLQHALPYHIIVLAQKLSATAKPDNSLFLSGRASYRVISPFLSDRGQQCVPKAGKTSERCVDLFSREGTTSLTGIDPGWMLLSPLTKRRRHV
jgi:SAM-dependent methyltransferase